MSDSRRLGQTKGNGDATLDERKAKGEKEEKGRKKTREGFRPVSLTRVCLKVYSGLLKQSLGFGLSVSLTEPAKPSLSPCVFNRNNRFPERPLIALTICIKSLYFYLM